MKQDNTSLSSVHSTANDFECPVCDSKAVDTHWRTETFSYGLPDSAVMLRVELPLRHCSTCEFEFIDDEGEQLKHAAVCRHLGVLTPAEVRAARERHKMTRTAFAEATALGEATLSRWEAGAVIQNRAYDFYLRLVRMPGVMSILQRFSTLRSKPSDVVRIGMADPQLPHSDLSDQFPHLEINANVCSAEKNFHLWKESFEPASELQCM